MLGLSGYSLPVQDFGKRVRAVREAHELQQMTIARKVTDSDKAAKSFSNYLSRIERGDETNPSLLLLEQIATGMGLTLSTFFAQIERAEKTSLNFRVTSSDNPSNQTRDPGATDGQSRTVRPDATADDSPSVAAAFAALVQRVDALEARDRRVENRHRQNAGHDRPQPKARKARRA
jgi:transcriptional regulator with XRE-family HTH domain